MSRSDRVQRHRRVAMIIQMGSQRTLVGYKVVGQPGGPIRGLERGIHGSTIRKDRYFSIDDFYDDAPVAKLMRVDTGQAATVYGIA